MLGTQSMCKDNTERWGDYLCSCVRIMNTPVMCLSEALERDRPTVSCACAQGLLCLCMSRPITCRWHPVALASWGT